MPQPVHSFFKTFLQLSKILKVVRTFFWHISFNIFFKQIQISNQLQNMLLIQFQVIRLLRIVSLELPIRHLCSQKGAEPVWPDLAIYWTFGNFSKPLATINLAKYLTFLGNFGKGVKILNFSSEIIFGATFIEIWRVLLVTLCRTQISSALPGKKVDPGSQNMSNLHIGNFKHNILSTLTSYF